MEPIPVHRILSPELIVEFPHAVAKEEAFRRMVERLCAVRALKDPAFLLAKIMERESGPSTILETGLALPHARVDTIQDIVAVLGLFRAGLPDASSGGRPAQAAFMFFSPNRPEAFSRHLQLIRAVASVFNPALLGELKAAASPEQALELLKSAEASRR